MSTLSNMNISETSRPIAIKFYLKHHWGGGKAALGFGLNRNETGFHGNRYLQQGYNGEYVVVTVAPSFFIGSSPFLQVTRTTTRSWMSLKFGQI